MRREDYEPKVTVICPVCGIGVERFASQIRSRGAKYCSYACRNADMKPQARVCKFCRETFTPAAGLRSRPDRGKFCSRECYNAAQALAPKVQSFSCEGCGREFTRPNAWVRRSGKPTFCSRSCADKSKHRPGSTHHRGSGWLAIKRAVRERDGNRCVRCGSPEPTGRLLAVDHIIPWVLMKTDESLANHGDNLASLCSPCHAVKTHSVEPKLMRGDLSAVVAFYGEEIAQRANRNWNLLGLALGANESEARG